jgi:hypothetical protein
VKYIFCVLAATFLLLAVFGRQAEAAAARDARRGWWDDFVDDLKDTAHDIIDVVDDLGGDHVAGELREVVDGTNGGTEIDDEDDGGPPVSGPARYGRPPVLTLTAEHVSYAAGEVLTLDARCLGGSGRYDLYLALQAPSGTVVGLLPDGRVSPNLTATALGWSFREIVEDTPILSLRLPAGLPEGAYRIGLFAVWPATSPYYERNWASVAAAEFTYRDPSAGTNSPPETQLPGSGGSTAGGEDEPPASPEPAAPGVNRVRPSLD